MSRHLNELSESELIRAVIIVDNKLKLGYLDDEIVAYVETFTTDAQWNEWVENSNKARLFVHLMDTCSQSTMREILFLKALLEGNIL